MTKISHKEETLAAQEQKQQKYSQWLKNNNVQIQSHLFTTTTTNVVAGWGCVATSFIKKGTILFTIPKEACFTAAVASSSSPSLDNASVENEEDDEVSVQSVEEDDDDPTTSDTQKDLALRLLHEMHKCKNDKDRRKCKGDNGNSITHSNGDDKIEINDKQNDWTPFLNLLTPHPLPWTWPKDFRRRILHGTELEHVVEKKVERIQKEYMEIRSSSSSDCDADSSITYQEYLQATSLVTSHANPWFGVSIVPFNTTLNCPNVGNVANVEFDLAKQKKLKRGGEYADVAKELIIGKTTQDIQPGQELFQPYGDSIAELIYKYGFAPSSERGFSNFEDGMDNGRFNNAKSEAVDKCGDDEEDSGDSVMGSDVVSLSIHDIVHFVEKVVLQSEISRDKNGCGSSVANNDAISHLQARLAALKQSGAIDESPWDGMEGWEYVTAELSIPSESFMACCLETTSDKDNKKRRKRNGKSIGTDDDRSIYDDGGISKLIGICLVLLSEEKHWERASLALERMTKVMETQKGNLGGVNNGDDGSNNSESDDETEEEGVESYSEEVETKSDDDNGEDEESNEDEDNDDDDESRSDDIAASLLLSALANASPSQSMLLQERALDVGMDDHDPWRALLLAVVEMDCGDGKRHNKKRRGNNDHCRSTSTSSSKSCLPWESAFEVARSVIQHRLDALLEGEQGCKYLLDRADKKPNQNVTETMSGCGADDFVDVALSEEEKVEAIGTIQSLRNVEKSILSRAMNVLEMTSSDMIL